MRGQCEGCHLAGQVKRNQGLHQVKLVGRATTPGESLHADVAGPIVPMGIGKAKYVLVVVDECTCYSWVFPVRKKGSHGAADGASNSTHKHPDRATGGTRGTPAAH